MRILLTTQLSGAIIFIGFVVFAIVAQVMAVKMNLFKTLRWYIRLYKVRRSGNYPINSRHIWRVAKFMSRDVT